MPDTQFEALRLELLRGGVAPVYIERTLRELDEHLRDLEDSARAAGLSADEAARSARAALGDESAIAAAVFRRPELLAWSTRHPRAAQYLQAAAAIGVLPGAPLMFCIEHRFDLARWSVALGGGTAIVGTLLATLNWLIVI